MARLLYLLVVGTLYLPSALAAPVWDSPVKQDHNPADPEDNPTIVPTASEAEMFGHGLKCLFSIGLAACCTQASKPSSMDPECYYKYGYSGNARGDGQPVPA